jgi:nitrite reductase/ring-hydroxylating ferredoxin subunit/Fe-S cluster biogenesis protein NfuA
MSRVLEGPAATEDRDLATLLAELESLDAIVDAWDQKQRAVVVSQKAAIEALHREALRRLLRSIKDEPAAVAAVKRALGDEVVYAVLRRHGLVRPSLQERVETALESVRPMLAAHGGGVELAAVVPPDAVDLRFLGSCDGCPASMLTFVAGVKKAVQDMCPEITEVRQSKGLSGTVAHDSVRFVSPFALAGGGEWLAAGRIADIPEGGIRTAALAGHQLIFSRTADAVTCFENACAHMGLPLDSGATADGLITCPHHAFQYDLASGECLTAREVALHAHAVRVIGDNVEVRLAP